MFLITKFSSEPNRCSAPALDGPIFVSLVPPNRKIARKIIGGDKKERLIAEKIQTVAGENAAKGSVERKRF